MRRAAQSCCALVLGLLVLAWGPCPCAVMGVLLPDAHAGGACCADVPADPTPAPACPHCGPEREGPSVSDSPTVPQDGCPCCENIRFDRERWTPRTEGLSAPGADAQAIPASDEPVIARQDPVRPAWTAAEAIGPPQDLRAGTVLRR